jgi:hypothetical protein
MTGDETEWVAIPGWEGLYEAHPSGQIRSLDRVIRVANHKQSKPGRILRASRRGRYLAVHLAHEDRKTHRYVHHIIAEVFIGPRPVGLVVCHFDGDRTNNSVDNLRYDSRVENNLDTVRYGGHQEAARTHCDAGHPFTSENTRSYPSRKGRVCITCARRRSAEFMRARRTKAREATA